MTEAGPGSVPRVRPENFWNEVWHENCASGRGAPMRHLAGRLMVDGSKFRLYECVVCNQRCYAGLDKDRRIRSVAASDEQGGESPKNSTNEGGPGGERTVIHAERETFLALGAEYARKRSESLTGDDKRTALATAAFLASAASDEQGAVEGVGESRVEPPEPTRVAWYLDR